MSDNDHRQQITALVADDDDQNARLLVRILEGGGFKSVDYTTDSSEVLPRCEADSPDLLLLDVSMPTPNGFDILEALAASEGDVPVTVVLTGHEHPSIERRALELGAAAVVGKTASRHDLLDKVDAALAAQ